MTATNDTVTREMTPDVTSADGSLFGTVALLLLAIAVGAGVGILAGGTLRELGERRFAFRPLLAAAVFAQVMAALTDGGLAAAALVFSFALLAAFALTNVHLVGMGLVVVGTAMNLVVVAANGSMPVRAEALVAAGIADWDELASVELGPKHHLERADDRLTALGDVVPVPGLGHVVSFGDLVLAVGAADVVANLVRAPRRRRHTPDHRGRLRVPQLG